MPRELVSPAEDLTLISRGCGVHGDEANSCILNHGGFE